MRPAAVGTLAGLAHGDHLVVHDLTTGERPAAEPAMDVTRCLGWVSAGRPGATVIDEGARLVAGGPGLPEGVNRGYFVRPTVFADVSPDMTIFRQEIFGPVLSITPFDTEEEAVELANDTIYGLTNYVQTQDGARRNRLARQLKAGMIEMNGVSRGRGSAFGGVKASGRAREGGVWGLEEFMDSKQISGWDKDA